MEVDKRNSKVLIVDDNPVNIDFLVELLKEYDARTVLDGFTALEAIEEEPPDIILLDIAMPGLNGFEVCQKIKSSPKTRNIPIVFLTASNDTESLVKAFELGGSDYISKPYNTEEVLVRLQTHLKLKKALELLDYYATHDVLTDTTNRKKFFHDSKHWMEGCKRGIQFSLYILSVKEIGKINEQYGYDIGDEVLKAVAMIIKRVIKQNHSLSRFGGADFFLTFKGQDVSETLRYVQKVQSTAKKIRLKSTPKLSFELEVRYSSSRESDKHIEEVIKRAYVVKEKEG